MQGVLGVIAVLGLAWAIGERRGEVRWAPVAVGVALQFAIAFVLLRAPFVKEGLLLVNNVVEAIEVATTAGASLVFGFLGGAELPFEVTTANAPYIFAFRILPQILVFSVLVALLWHWRVLPVVIRAFAWALKRSLGVGGAVGVAASSSVFLGMVEAPLAIRAYLAHISRSELFVVMTCGMSTVAGSIMVLYAGLLAPVIDGALGHILVGSVVNVLGAVVIARIVIPEDGHTAGEGLADALKYDSVIDAIARGAADGTPPRGQHRRHGDRDGEPHRAGQPHARRGGGVRGAVGLGAIGRLGVRAGGVADGRGMGAGALRRHLVGREGGVERAHRVHPTGASRSGRTE